ncbi:MAG: Fic family protein [Actinobacteria bacterium]|nr:Fic family protein [Actinomycetota bacterium]
MRTGRYVTQGTGKAQYKAFIPNPLPFQLNMDNNLQSLLSRADVALGRLDGITEILPDVDYFIFMYVRKEATLSSQVEGTKATFSDALKAEASIKSAEIHDDVDEILNYIEAMNYGLQRLDTLPISLRLIREIHGILLSGVRGERKTPGEFRKSQNWVGGNDIRTASFMPPPAGEIPALLSNLEKFIHDKSPLPSLVKAGLLHSQFETIHPFLDGNGRIGRLLITFFLCQQGMLNKPLLYISEFFMENRDKYYEQLNSYHDKGYVEGWLRFFLDGVLITAERSIETARKVLALREQDVRKISEAGGSAQRALSLLDALYHTPLVRVKDIEGLVDIRNPNALALTNKMIKLGILKEITGQKRNRVFAYDDYIKLFQSD